MLPATATNSARLFPSLGVPAMAVNGKWFTTVGRPTQVRTFAELIGTVEHLIASESRAAR